MKLRNHMLHLFKKPSQDTCIRIHLSMSYVCIDECVTCISVAVKTSGHQCDMNSYAFLKQFLLLRFRGLLEMSI